ncbi:MAG: phasin family protein [bacterium]
MIKFDEFQSINKDGMEAFIASATAWSKGMQAIAMESADFSRKAFEKNAQAFEKVLGAKSVDKAVEAQQGFAKDAYESYVGQLNKIGEIYLSTAREAYKPLESQLAQSANSVANAAKAATPKA